MILIISRHFFATQFKMLFIDIVDQKFDELTSTEKECPNQCHIVSFSSQRNSLRVYLSR